MTQRVALAGALALLSVLVIASAPPAAGAGGGTEDGEGFSVCDDADQKLASAKRKLKKLKQENAPAKAIGKAKKKVRKAKELVEACKDDEVTLFDVTGLSASFDATVVRDDDDSCSFTKDAHWTASIAPGNPPAELGIYYRDNQGRPVYFFSGPAGGIATVASGTGRATRTCDSPSPGNAGTVTCTFARELELGSQISSDPDAGRDPMTLHWSFGFSGIQYGTPSSGGSCQYSGARPPTLLGGESSPGLFVSPHQIEPNPLEPEGISTVSPSTFQQENVTLSFSGSGSAAFGGSLESSYAMTVTLDRR